MERKIKRASDGTADARNAASAADSAEDESALAALISVGSLTAVFVLCVWYILFDWPVWTIMTMMLFAPFLALVAWLPLRAGFAGLPPYFAVLPGLTVLAPLALLFATTDQFNFLDRHAYDWILLVIAFLLALPLLYIPKSDYTEVDRDSRDLMRLWAVAVLICIPFVYADGAARLLDVGFDRSAPATYRATLLEKELTYPIWARKARLFHWRDEANTWLRLSPWGPDRDKEDVDLEGHDLYDAVNIGGTVCVHLHSGFLGRRWYDVSKC